MSDFTFNKLVLKINYFIHPILKGKRAKTLYIQPIGPFPFDTDDFFKIVINFLQIFFNTKTLYQYLVRLIS